MEAIPTPAPALTPDIEAIVETVLQRTTGTLLETLVAGLSVDTETSEDTELPAGPTSVDGPQSQVVEVQDVPALGPAAFLYSGVDGFGALPIAQRVSEAGGLTITANGSVKVSADEAYVVVIPEQFYGPTGPEKLSSEDREDVVQNLMAIGIGEDDVEFASGQQYDPETIVSNQHKWDTVGAERSGAGWRSGELLEGPVVASSPFGGLSLHLLPAL